MTFAQDRFGRVIGVNGIDRGIHWDTFGGSADNLGIDAPSGAVTITGAGSGTIDGVYDCYYRYVDDRDGHKRYSDLSPVLSFTATTDLELEWSALAQSSQSRVNKVELWRTALADANTNKLYLVATMGRNGTKTSSASNGAGAPKVNFTVPKGHGLLVGPLSS